MFENYDEMRMDIDSISRSTIKELENQLQEYLDKCGIFYKIFARIKKSASIIEKLKDRQLKGIENYRMQDLVGIRVVLYFKNDIPVCEKIIKQHFEIVNVSKDAEEEDKFKPQRINYVCKLPERVVSNFEAKVWSYPIDPTFEIQVRTIFSEGWHEIEHDFRYKCLHDWDHNEDLSRTLNGIFATLENCDWAISSLLTQVAYRHYKSGEWIPMLKNTFRIRITDVDDMDMILEYFDRNKDVAKMFFRLDREEFLLWLSDKKKIPLKLRNVVFLANMYSIHDGYIDSLIPVSLKNMME